MNPTAESRLNPRLKLALHSQFADVVAGRRTYPINVEISPCGVCQASCRGCWYAHTDELEGHRKVFLKAEVLIGLLWQCSDLGVKSVSWTGGGEPSLYPDIKEAVAFTASCGLEQGMFTNALAMPRYDPSLLRWIRVTMTDKPYKVDCIKPLRAAQALGFAFNYGGPHDDAYLWETLGIAEQVDADYVQVRPELKWHGDTVDIEPPRIVHPLLHVTGYKFEEAKKKHGYAECVGYHLVPFVWEDGNVDACAYMRRYEGYTLGNLYRNTLKEILDDAPDFVSVHPGCQVCCRNHEINSAVHAARRLEDVNFP